MSGLTHLYRVGDAIAEHTATVPEPDDAATALFGGTITTPENWNVPAGPDARPTRIFVGGEPVPAGGPFPQAIIRFDDEDLEEPETTEKLSHRLPWSLEVRFDRGRDQEGAPDLRAIHTRLVAEVKDVFATDDARGLPLVGYVNPSGNAKTVVDNAYEGGGAKLTPLDEDAEGGKGPHRYSFKLFYVAIYRHQPTDSRTQA